jgi:hypothetical protein
MSTYEPTITAVSAYDHGDKDAVKKFVPLKQVVQGTGFPSTTVRNAISKLGIKTEVIVSDGHFGKGLTLNDAKLLVERLKVTSRKTPKVNKQLSLDDLVKSTPGQLHTARGQKRLFKRPIPRSAQMPFNKQPPGLIVTPKPPPSPGFNPPPPGTLKSFAVQMLDLIDAGKKEGLDVEICVSRKAK